MLRLFNSLTNQKEDFKSIIPGEVSMYTCGPTVYNYAHVGNFRAYFSADILRRYLIFSGYKVKWVMNITDIDDKTIRDSALKYEGLDPMEALNKFCRFYEDRFFEDLEILNIKKSDFFSNPRATDYIDQQKDLVLKIFKAGYAYESGGSVYFDLAKFSKEKGYGRLVNIDFSNLKSSGRVDLDEYEKEQLADFVLWKGKKSGEPHWDFDFNGIPLPGRPGWHLECSAMEKEILGLPFDIHNGGKDLKFPHHEDEIAQSYAGYGLIPNNYFIHNGHLLVDGEKMAKSKGNFYLIKDLINKGYCPDTIRFALVLNHYLLDFNLTDNGLNSAKVNLDYIREFYSQLENDLLDKGKQSNNLVNELKSKFIESMDDDLNVPQAISYILKFIKDVREQGVTNKQSMVNLLDELSSVFGVSFKKTQEQIPNEIIQLAKNRKIAKINSNYDQADKIRAEIECKGYTIKDTNDTYELKLKT